MIGWPLSPPCAVACLFGDESQQPIFPHVMHMRRCTQRLPIFKHSSHPAISAGRAVTSTWSRWLQIGLAADIRLSSRLVAEGKRDGVIAGRIGPPRLEPEPGAVELPLEHLAAKLCADLDPQQLISLEGDLEAEPADENDVCFAGAKADLHPFVSR